MRTKTTILGVIAALFVATLSANAGNQASHRVQSSLVSLKVATTAIATADRDAATARKGTAEESSSEPAKPVAAVKPAVPKGIATTPACRQAINNLKTLNRGVAATQWRTALQTARAACLTQPTAACQAAIASLQASLPAKRVSEQGELLRDLHNFNWPAQLVSLRSAFQAVVTACAIRD